MSGFLLKEFAGMEIHFAEGQAKNVNVPLLSKSEFNDTKAAWDRVEFDDNATRRLSPSA